MSEPSNLPLAGVFMLGLVRTLALGLPSAGKGTSILAWIGGISMLPGRLAGISNDLSSTSGIELASACVEEFAVARPTSEVAGGRCSVPTGVVRTEFGGRSALSLGPSLRASGSSSVPSMAVGVLLDSDSCSVIGSS